MKVVDEDQRKMTKRRRRAAGIRVKNLDRREGFCSSSVEMGLVSFLEDLFFCNVMGILDGEGENKHDCLAMEVLVF